MGGVIALTLNACGTDSIYDEIDQQNADMNAPPSFNNNNSGQYQGYGPGNLDFWGDNYISPWDVWYRTSDVNGLRDLQPSYFFSNGNADSPISPYRVEIFAYIGLAYFDGTNDGIYNDPKLLLNTGNGFVTNLGSGNYPNLYPNTIVGPYAAQPEVGHLVKTPIHIDLDAYPAPNYSFRHEDLTYHLPVNTSNFTTFPKFGGFDGFDFGGSITPQEE